MTLRAVVVDDEPLAREGLAAQLRTCDVAVLAECADGFAALDAVREHRPDLLMLDIAMPELDGFGVLERLEPEELPTAIVFVTAYDAHAVRAFDAHALDYLLKPVAPERLREAIGRARRRVLESRAHAATLDREAGFATEQEGHAPRYLAQLLVRQRDQTTVIPVSELEWIEADSYYVRLHTTAGTRPRLLRERMSVLETRLDPAVFVRTHRSAIVRIAAVRTVRAVSRYEHVMILASGAHVPLSRERRASVEARLALL